MQSAEKNNLAKKKVAFICPYPENTAPGQRFRVELFYDYLRERIDFKPFHFLDAETNRILYKPGNYVKKIWGVLKGLFRRIAMLPALRKFEYVFIFRECTPIGPPIFEFIIAKILRKKIIYDFDDAIWMSNTTSENRVTKYIKFHSKVGMICKWAHVVSVGNDFLGDYARQFSNNVMLIPTVVDTERHHYKRNTVRDNDRLNIGWTGSHSSIRLLDPIIPILQKLQLKFDFNFILIANRNPKLSLKNYRFIPWNATTETIDLNLVDIGIMPLEDDKWCKGKCGFKAIQYMSLSIPAVISGVGVNEIIVDHGVNGFLCYDESDWEIYLEKLLTNPSLRDSFGEDARIKIESQYSLKAVLPNYFKLFGIDSFSASTMKIEAHN